MIDNSVEIASVAGNAASLDLSIWGLVMQADLVVKFVMLLLVLSSIWCWAIIFEKWIFFRSLKYRISLFERAYNSSRDLNPLYKKLKSKKSSNPMAKMFITGMNEVQLSLGGATKSQMTMDLINITKDKIYHLVHRNKNESLEKMEKNLIVLATVGSATPFIGLFGTVWGIVNSFQAIAATKNTSLAVVAPGIAEALFATALGLFAAIPAVVFYNLFSNQIRQISGKLDDFNGEISSILVYNFIEKPFK